MVPQRRIKQNLSERARPRGEILWRGVAVRHLIEIYIFILYVHVVLEAVLCEYVQCQFSEGILFNREISAFVKIN